MSLISLNFLPKFELIILLKIKSDVIQINGITAKTTILMNVFVLRLVLIICPK
jgi:hypothetical protein